MKAAERPQPLEQARCYFVFLCGLWVWAGKGFGRPLICMEEAALLYSYGRTFARGPASGTPPMAKVMRKEAWHTQRRDQASGNPLFPSI